MSGTLSWLMKIVEAAMTVRRRWQSNPYGLIGIILLISGALLAVYWGYQLLEEKFDAITATAVISLAFMAGGALSLYWSYRLRAVRAEHSLGGQFFAEVKDAAVKLDLHHLFGKEPVVPILMGAVVVGLVLGMLTSSKRS